MQDRIKIEDLPVLEDLKVQDVKGIFGGSDVGRTSSSLYYVSDATHNTATSSSVPIVLGRIYHAENKPPFSTD